MGRRGRKADWHDANIEATTAREALERRWLNDLVAEPRLATMVTASRGQVEPFHRWLHFRQGFSPGLVRLFLKEIGTDNTVPDFGQLSVLDPFAGSGTTLVECARQNIAAVGVDATPALSFIHETKATSLVPPLPEMGDADTWEAIAEKIDAKEHRVALMLAVAKQYTTAGKPNRGAKPLCVLLSEVVNMMTEDISARLPRHNKLYLDDARTLDSIEDESIDVILTSPPYVSRHDYSDIAEPYDRVYQFFCQQDGLESTKIEQIRAYKRDENVKHVGAQHHAAINEITRALLEINEKKLARIVTGYFEDMVAVLRSCRRTLMPAGVFWLVVGGGRFKGVHMPSDIIVAELAQSIGFEVEAIRVARDVINARQKFGRLGHLSPRESLIVLRKT